MTPRLLMTSQTYPRPLAAALVLIILGSMLPAHAQDDLENARAQREALQQQAALTAGQIDALNAEDAEIVAALQQIDGWIAIQESHLATAEQDLVITLEIEADAHDFAAQLAAEIESIKAAIAQQLVEGYVQGFSSNDEVLLNARDINIVPMLRFVLDEAAGVANNQTDLLRVAQDRQEDAIADAQAASAQAAQLRDEIDRQIDDLDASRVVQEELRAEVNDRVAILESEAALLADEDAQVTAFIRAEEERIRREEEERQRALEEERRRLAEEEARRIAAEEAAQLEAEEAEAAETRRLEEEAEAARQAEEDAANGDNGADSQPDPEPQPDSGAPNFIRPVSGGVSSGFGLRIHPIYGTSRMHTGIDYNGASGSPIGAAASGTIIFVGPFSGYGNTVIVSHSGGYSSLYAHQSAFNTNVGATVNAGDTVGFIGSTGLSTGPHLHFEIRLNGVAIDPAPFV